MMVIDVFPQDFLDETVLEGGKEEHGGPLARAPDDAEHHAEEQRRHREEEAVVVQIQRQRAEVLLPTLILQVVHVVEEFTFGQKRENGGLFALAPRDHPVGDGVEILEKLVVEKLVKQVELQRDVEHVKNLR